MLAHIRLAERRERESADALAGSDLARITNGISARVLRAFRPSVESLDQQVASRVLTIKPTMTTSGMAIRASKGGTTARPRSRTGRGTVADNGKNWPMQAVKTNDKRKIVSQIRQKWLVNTRKSESGKRTLSRGIANAASTWHQTDEQSNVAGMRSACASPKWLPGARPRTS